MELAARQGFVVPRGVMHRTRADERSVILMLENAGIIPTGNWVVWSLWGYEWKNYLTIR